MTENTDQHAIQQTDPSQIEQDSAELISADLESTEQDSNDSYAYMAETALLFAAYTPISLLTLFVANLLRIRFPQEKAALLADLLLIYGPPVTLVTAIILGATVANAKRSIAGAIAFWFSVVMLVVWVNAVAYLGVFD